MDAGPKHEQSAPLPLGRGDVILGKYRVERVLGIGGMGVVYAAVNIHLDQRVALKLLLPEAVAKKDVVARFAREARAAAKILSEHVARVIDVGVADPYGPFMVLELLEGCDLADTLDRDGALPIGLAVGYLLQACEAIAEAHSLGIVHRDLKPENLFLAQRPEGGLTVKVLDFGISKIDAAAGASASLLTQGSITQTSSVMGSPMYMSPEQLRASRSVDARSDIWSLGVTLYELLSCEGPFPAGTVPELCASVLKDAPKPIRELRADVPETLERVIARCLEKAAEDRFANVGELAEALAPFAGDTARISCERISRLSLRVPISRPDAQLSPRATSVPPPSAMRRERRRPPTSVSAEITRVPVVASEQQSKSTAATWHTAPPRPRTPRGTIARGVGVGVILMLAGAAVLLVRRPLSPAPSDVAPSLAAPNPMPVSAAPSAAAPAAPEPEIAPDPRPFVTAAATAEVIGPKLGPLPGKLPVHRLGAALTASAAPPPPPAQSATASPPKRSAFDDRK